VASYTNPYNRTVTFCPSPGQYYDVGPFATITYAEFNGSAVIQVSKSTTATDTRTSLSTYDPSAPFATIGAAKTAAVSGDVVTIGPGTYDEVNVAKSGVGLLLSANTTISRTTTGVFTHIIDDSAGAIVTRITGPGSLATTDAGGSGGGPVFSVDPASVIDLDLFSIVANCAVADGGTPCVGTHDGGTIRGFVTTLSAPGTASGYGRAVYWQGTGHIDIASLLITGGIVGNSSANASSWYVKATEYQGSISLGGVAATPAVNQDRIWLTFDLARCSTDVDVAKDEVYLADAHDVFFYLEGKKFVGGISCSGTNSEFYITGQKHTHAAAATIPLLELGTGKGFVKLDAMLDVASSSTSAPLVKITGGEHWLDLGEVTKITASNVVEVTGGTLHLRCSFVGGASGKGILVSGGTLILESGSRLDTSANSSSDPITKSGGTVIIEAGVVLISHSARNSISAATAQNVVTYGHFAKYAKDADVTFVAGLGTETVSTNVV